ncbi:hypothetical protein D210916BOD24_27310 [Alteromonas sp. D210916BOD_24]|uniref:hypothetical protein n=1 Tax=Alteromonas sp. D210916BOD_24 TaxID=3157618 RepID=UPI00399C59DC
MLNKKTLAVAIAASISTGAFAVQDISDKDTKAIKVASELQSTSATTTTVVNAANKLDVSSVVGFGFATGTTRYISFTLENAKFAGAVNALTLTDTDTSGAVLTATKLDGGVADASRVIYEVTVGTAAAAADDVFTLDMGNIKVTNGKSVNATYAIYETLTNAASGTGALKSFTGPVSTFASATVKSPIAKDSTTLKPTATVGSEFTEFDNAQDTKAIIGKVDTTGTVDTTVIAPDDGLAVDPTDIFAPAARTVTLTGDLSFVDDSFLSVNADCSTDDVQLVESEDKTKAVSATNDLTMSTTANYVCLTVDGKTEIVKGGYSLTLTNGTNTLSGALSNVVYDTLSVEVPYLTTFSGYNQRLFIVNKSSLPANYSFSFTSETGVTAAKGTAAEGTVPAKSMLAIKATDIVTLTGKTRTSAVLELEAEDASIKVTSQTVNLADGTTDTVIYN